MLKTVVGDGGQHERQAWHGAAAMPATGRQPPAGPSPHSGPSMALLTSTMSSGGMAFPVPTAGEHFIFKHVLSNTCFRCGQVRWVGQQVETQAAG